MKEIVSKNPHNETVLKRIPVNSKKEIKKAIQRARKTQSDWAKRSVKERTALLKKLKPLIKKREEEIAETIHTEMGKPKTEAVAEVNGVIESIDFHCSNDPKHIKPITLFDSEEETNIQLFEPRGVIAVITPWNFPFSIPFSGILPSLIAGNTVVCKPSELTTLVGLEVKKIFRELEKQGLPTGAVNFMVGGKKTGKFIVNQDIDMVSFVGSRRAGVEIMRDSAEQLHSLILELGGKDPAIVCGDADLNKAAQGIVNGALRNCGQVCCSIERVYVEEPIYDEFVELVVKETKKLEVGSGESADIGPMIAEFQRKTVKEHIKDAVKKGAEVLVGGKSIPGKGYWFEPTVLVNVNHSMKIMTEETFGPCIPIMKVKDTDSAIELANDTIYGLTASIWTENRKKGKELARKIKAGTIAVNRRGGGKKGCPWGGAKQSGIGRQNAKESIQAYSEIKHLWIK